MVLKVWRRVTEGGLSSSQRRTPCKVTFGIWVVTHSSAGERLGYMLLWKCTSCMIILYSRLNGVHPILYLVNMSHLICVCVCLSCVSPMCVRHGWETQMCERTGWPSEYEPNIVCPRLKSSHTNERCMSVYGKAYPLWPLTHLRLLCQTSRDHREHLMFLRVASDGRNLRWQRSTEEVSLCNIKQRLSWRRLLFIYIAFWMATSTICTGLNHKPIGMGLLWQWAYWG